jgi:hypothetical protein
MDAQQFRLQLARLERHYTRAQNERDAISFLDLAHVLRIWTEMKSDVDDLARARGVSLNLPHLAPTQLQRQARKGGGVIDLPLAGGVSGPTGTVWGVRLTLGRSRHEEIEGKPVREPPKAVPTKMSFTDWLAAAVYWAPSDDPKHRELAISREIIIKRVANVLGASHPAGKEDSDSENRFDPYIKNLHNLQVLDLPATYGQLLEIAKPIIEAAQKLVTAQESTPSPPASRRSGWLGAVGRWLKRLVTSGTTQRRLTLIPEPKPGTRSVLVQPPGAAPFPFIIGVGNLDLLCGQCGAVLLKSVVEGQVSNVVFKCPTCGNFSEAA